MSHSSFVFSVSLGRHLILNTLECDSLADGDHRTLRGSEPCECKEGWGGINCNGAAVSPFTSATLSLILPPSPVCKTDAACVGFPLPGAVRDGLDDTVANMTCYNGGETVFSNHQMCDITSKLFYALLLLLVHPVVRPQDSGHASRSTSSSDFWL